jgi:predicted CXXCH cytochrome family protein
VNPSSLARSATLLFALAATAGLPSLAAQEQGAAANAGCYECHATAEDPMEFSGGVKVSVRVDKPAFLASAHGKQECVACHVGLDPLDHTGIDRPTHAEYRKQLSQRCLPCHADAAEHAAVAGRSERLVGAMLHSAEKPKSPLCVDCHPAHSVQRGEPGREAIGRACANCHDKVYATYAASVHGKGVSEKGADSPSCTDCHRGHEATGKGAAEHAMRLGQPCMNCHGDAQMMEKHGISTNVVSTYVNDFHGMNVKFYDEAGKGIGMPTLVCADCHGIHDVAAAEPGNTRLLKENLTKVCQQCHKDASLTFSDAWLSHYEPSLDNAPLVFAVEVSYLIFIPFVIIGLSLQIFAHVVLFPRIQRRRRQQGLATAVHHHADDREVVRFSPIRRLEHLLVMITFILLLVTGLPQKFHDSGWAVWTTQMLGGIDSTRLLHRITGVVFSVLCVVHLTIALVGVLTGRLEMNITPQKADFRDAIQNLKYYIGLAPQPPKFGRYDYRQKFEYWGMVVGSGVMILSGFVLFFPILFAEFLPGQFIPAAKAAHTYEAMMALLTIIIWHMYGAHLNPDCFPIDKSIFTGRISMARMHHEHALELEHGKGKLVIVEGAPAKAADVAGADAEPPPA